MGFFSFKCKACSKSLLHPNKPVNQWMAETTMAYVDGSVFEGRYDCYGTVHGEEESRAVKWHPETYASVAASLYHTACYHLSGEPKYSGPSESADDQGHFFDHNSYDIPEPTDAESLATVVAFKAGDKP